MPKRARHEWEGGAAGAAGAGRARAAAHEWDVSDGEAHEAHQQEPGAWDSATEEEEEIDEEGRRAQEHMVEMVLNANARGRMPATESCVLLHWAAKGGLEAARSFGKAPGAPSGHYQRHLDTALGLDERDPSHYMFDMPAYDKARETRQVKGQVAIPAHESLVAEARRDSRLRDVHLEHAEWPPAYHEHPAIAAAPAADKLSFIPTALYFDGVPVTKTDGFLGVFLVNLITDVRHTVVLVRKSDYCRCGCRGWCTLYCIFAFVTWSLIALQRGGWPEVRHDNAQWGEWDTARAVMHGSLGLRAIVLFLKADWSEFCSVLGLPTWSSTLAPCPLCNCTTDNMLNLVNMSLIELPWQA